jgi:hypothetical protein
MVRLIARGREERKAWGGVIERSLGRRTRWRHHNGLRIPPHIVHNVQPRLLPCKERYVGVSKGAHKCIAFDNGDRSVQRHARQSTHLITVDDTFLSVPHSRAPFSAVT